MNVLILAAGYATRLYPLTLTQPKPLLPVAGKPMINYVLDNLATIEGLDHAFVVTNDKFTSHFERWAELYHDSHPKLTITIVNDHSTDDTNKLGAIGDLHYVLEQKNLTDDLIVVAGDNLFSHDLREFGRYCRTKSSPVLAVYDVGDLEHVKKFSVVNVDENSRITLFQEKPPLPTSTLIGIALYYYPRATLPLIRQYIRDGNNPDQPGRLIQWFYQRIPVHAWRVPGLWYDIGSKETLEEANRIFGNKDALKSAQNLPILKSDKK